MKIKKYLPQLERIVSSDLKNLEDKSIFLDDGIYHVFGNYSIQPRDDGFLVTKHRQMIEEFGSLRAAMAWCSADKLGKSHLSKSIVDLERKRKVVGQDLVARSYLAKKIQDCNRREAAEIKIDHRRRKIRIIENQLDKCINLAKYWQIQGFNNETPRTGRTVSNRTSR